MRLKKRLYSQRYLIAMCAPFVVWVIIFSYLPLGGWIMAFQNYKPQKGIGGSDWVGLQNFMEFLSDRRFFEVFRNTVAMGGMILVFGILCAILLALMLNEIRAQFFKRTVQTLSYLPHFISWVIVANIFYKLLSTDGGLFNDLLVSLGIISQPVSWMSKGNLFWIIITIAQIWKETGWNAIIYLAAITAIDPQIYEAGEVDGLGRLGKIWHITLPGIRPTIIMMLVLSSGSLFNSAGFDMSYLMGNTMTLTYSDNLAVYAYRYGMQMSRYSMSAALSVFNSLLSLLLVFFANYLSARVEKDSVI